MPNRLITNLRVIWRKRFGVMPLRITLKSLVQWFDTPLGRALIEEEQVYIDEHLNNLFGYHLLSLSVTDKVNLMEASRISHKFTVYPSASENRTASAVVDYAHLPLPAESIDVILLHHVLDYSQNPHHLLREASRVIIPNGHLLLVGFNPWSLFGIGRWVAHFCKDSAHWRHQSLRLGRVLDWLTILDIEPIVIRQGFYRPPFQSSWSIKYLHWLEHWGKKLQLPWGGFYFIVARKDHYAMTPLKPDWQKRESFRGWGVIKILGRTARHQSKKIFFEKNIENS